MILPVFRTVAEAYAFVWRERRLFGWLALPAIVVSALLGVGQANFMPHGFSPFRSNADIFIAVLSWVADFGIFILYSVAWHRAYLLPQEPAGVAAAYRWRWRQTRFFFDYLKVGLAVIPIYVITTFILGFLANSLFSGPALRSNPEMAFAIVGGIGIIVFSVGLLVYARLSMLFPATAVDEHKGFFEGLEFTSGFGWELFWIVALAAAPFWLIVVPEDIGASLYRSAGGDSSLLARLLLTLGAKLIEFIGIAAGVSALSIAYKRLRDGRPATS